MSGEYSTSAARLREERLRLGLSQQALADALGVSKWTVINWEKTDERGTPIPADKLEGCVKQGMDVQYVLTGVRSANLNQVAEEAGAYNKEPQGVGALSREEEVFVQLLRGLKPKDRTHARAVVDALASAVRQKDKAGGED